MTVDELAQKLRDLEIPDHYYALNSVRPDAVCLETAGYGYRWKVYFYDRARGPDPPKYFKTESEACEYLFRRVVPRQLRPDPD